jgi:PKD repeat protein
VTLESRIASTPAGSSFSYYNWDFGDGSTASGGEAINHVYADAGTFLATVTASSWAGSARATLNIPVRSLTAEWSGDYGRVSITQDGLHLRGRYLDDPRQGIVEGRVSETGTVTFTITRPGLAPVTFTGTAGPDVMTLVGAENGRDGVDRPWKFTRY